MDDLKDVSKSDILQRHHPPPLIAGRVENCLRMAYACQQNRIVPRLKTWVQRIKNSGVHPLSHRGGVCLQLARSYLSIWSELALQVVIIETVIESLLIRRIILVNQITKRPLNRKERKKKSGQTRRTRESGFLYK